VKDYDLEYDTFFIAQSPCEYKNPESISGWFKSQI